MGYSEQIFVLLIIWLKICCDKHFIQIFEEILINLKSYLILMRPRFSSYFLPYFWTTFDFARERKSLTLYYK